MRIGLLIDRWEPTRGGAEAALDLLARHLVACGHEVIVVGERCSVPPPGAFHAVRAGGLSRGAHQQRLARGMVAAARGLGCDATLGVRHVEEVGVLWLHGGCHRATLAARRRATRRSRAVSERPIVPRGRHRVFDELEARALAGGARAVVCPSPLVQGELLARYPQSGPRLCVVENGVDVERFHPRARERARADLERRFGADPERAPWVSFVARNPLLKGLPPLLAALARVRAPYRLVIAGPRRPAAWARAARRAGVPRERVFAARHLDPVTAAAGVDVCALPTWRDTSGLVLLEALACGTPVVTSRHAGAAAGLSAAGGRAVDDPWDTGRLAEALEEALERARGDVDRGAVRAALAGRTADRMLAGLEACLERAAE